jgi:hypothetical protein
MLPPLPTAGQVRSSLGQAGDLATETAALLSMDAVQDDDQFTPEVGCSSTEGGALVNKCREPAAACAKS